MAYIVSKLDIPNISTSYAIRSGYTYGIASTTFSNSSSGYTYSGTITDSGGNTISIDALYEGLTIYVRFTTAPTKTTVKLNANGLGAVEIKYGSMETPHGKILAGALYALRYTIVNGTGYFLMVHSINTDTDTDTHYISTDVLSGSSSGVSNATSSTTNASTYLNHVENGEVRSSLRITGSGGTTVSGKNGILTITSESADTSLDEKVTVSTFDGSDYKQVVLHDGHGANDIGYGSNYLKFGLRTVTSGGGSGSLTPNISTFTYDELVIGNVTTLPSPQYSETHRGSIKLGRGYGNGNEIFGRLLSPTGGQTENSLPSLSGTLVSSGGFLTDGTVTVNNNVQTNATYYKCIYRNGHVYSAGIGSSQSVSDGNDYPETHMWYYGATDTHLGPYLYLGSQTTNFPGLLIDRIPAATEDNGGIVTAGTQSFGGRKYFDNDIHSEGNIYAGIHNLYGHGMWNGEYGRVIAGNIDLYNGDGEINTFETTIGSSFLTLHYYDGSHVGNPHVSIATMPFVTRKVYGSEHINRYYLPSVYNNDYHDHDGTFGIVTNVGTATGLIGVMEGNYLTTNGLSFGNDATKFLDNTGNWSVPAGGGSGGGTGNNAGRNVMSSTQNGNTNAASITNNSIYLNHIDSGNSVVSSNRIQGSGITTVSASNGQLTINTPRTTLRKADFRTMGALVGFIGEDNTQPIAVQPARPDHSYVPKPNAPQTFYTRQGVVKPFGETIGGITEFHTKGFGGLYGRESELGSNVIPAVNFNRQKEYLAIPILIDYWYNSTTQRYESVPYVLIPSNINDINGDSIKTYYSTTTFNPNQSEPQAETDTIYPYEGEYIGTILDERLL